MSRGKGGGSRGPSISLPQSGEVGGAPYVLESVTAGDVLAISKEKLKVDGEQVRAQLQGLQRRPRR